MDAVISLTNRKKIPMGLPNGQGAQVNLAPGETRLVRGDFEHYRRMPAQGMNGLVVKLVEGKSRLLEVEKVVDDVRLVRVTNHRNIPMRLSTGIGQKAVNIGPKETCEPVLVRIRTVKQMSGITVRPVEKTVDSFETRTDDAAVAAKIDAALRKDEENEVARKAEEKVEMEAALRKEEAARKVAEEAGLAKTAEEKALAKQAADEAIAAAKEAEANDPLAIKRRDLTLPATREEWDIHSQQLTWPDVRGLCKELGIRTKRMDKEKLLEAITKKLYPES